jgi:hypothetical protein
VASSKHLVGSQVEWLIDFLIVSFFFMPGEGKKPTLAARVSIPLIRGQVP